MRILVLDHKSDYLNEIIEYLRQSGIQFEIKQPMKVATVDGCVGVIASGGRLPKGNYLEILRWYKNFLNKLRNPFLGICLGQRIVGVCHGARVRKIPTEKGIVTIKFHKNFPLALGIKELKVFEDHDFELISTLPDELENYASSDECAIQAIKVIDRQQYAVQFHPERKDTDGYVILDNFIKICKSSD